MFVVVYIYYCAVLKLSPCPQTKFRAKIVNFKLEGFAVHENQV